MSAHAGRRRLQVGFILCPDFTLSALSLFIDTLRLASDREDRSGRVHCDWQVMSPHGNLIRSSCGIHVSPTSRLLDPAGFDYVAVVGGLLGKEQSHAEIVTYLRQASRAGTKLIGLCTGSFVLAAAGLMKHRTSCVSWLHYSDFTERFPNLAVSSREIYLEDKRVITCAGGSSVADLAAELVRRHVGVSAEKNAVEILHIERLRVGKDVQPRNPMDLPISDGRIKSVLAYMENNLENPVSVAQLASYMGVSRRQMERIFELDLKLSPVAAYMRLRMQRASELLARTNRPLVEVAFDSGFDNSSHFTRRFRTMFGCTPTAFRRNAHGEADGPTARVTSP